MRYEQFSPIETLKQLSFDDSVWVAEARLKVDGASLDELRKLNAHWFNQQFGLKQTASMLWLVNLRMTSLCVAPAWRGGPLFADINARAPNPPGGMQMLGSMRKKGLMRRWIDLQWLRTVLGPTHQFRHNEWKNAFSDTQLFAEVAWARINRVESTSSAKGGFGVQGAYMVIQWLKVPALHRVALTGLIDKNTAERRATAHRRVKEDVKPRLEPLMKQDRRPLTRDQFEHRLVVSEAIELGQGLPGDAATIFKWMTGTSITPQSMQVMRTKIAEQCGLTRMYWSRQRAKRSKAHPRPVLLPLVEEH